MPCIAIRAGEWSSRALYARLSGPEIAKVEGDRIERADAHRLVVLRARDQQPLPVVELERLESAIDRVDEPQVVASIVAEVVTPGRDVVDPLNTAGSGWRIPHRYGQARDSKIDQPSIREPIQSRPRVLGRNSGRGTGIRCPDL